jgi:putative Mg2+ transporter-C (MgtC) family protein
LCGFGHMELALVLALAVLFANIGLRRLSFLVQPALPVSEPSEGHYLIELTCLATEETHLRTLLLSTISAAPVSLQAIHSEDEPNSRTRLRAEVLVAGHTNRLIEDIALRLSMEPGVSSLSWSVVPTAME